MRRPTKLNLATVAASVALTIVAATAWAYWSAGSVPGGNGAAAATSVSQGATPTANAVGTTVTVSWTATTLASGTAVSGYLVKRYHSGTGVVQTILSACTGTIATLSCVESNVPAGSWKYTVTPKIGTNWVGQESSQSGTVTVTPPDTTAPANAITLSGVSGGAYKDANTIYYRGSAVGSFTLTNAVTDAGSGPASSQTATLGNTPTNWTHTGSTVSTPAGGPYVSNTFSWTAGATSSPTEAVTGRDVAGNTAVTNLSFVNDSTAPSAGTVTYTNGYQPGHSVPVTFTTGTDGGSGIATRQLQRDSAPLTGGTCGTWAGFINRGPDGATSIYTDSAVVAGNCYMYRYVVTDRVGNQHIATSASVSKIDYAGAVGATTGALSHWRLGEGATTLTSSDSFNGTSGALVTARSGEIGASWTNPVGNSNLKIGTENRAYRTSSGYALLYASGTPASPDYSVEADLYYKGAFASIAGGVIGRYSTTNTSFYMARWENDETWNIVKWSSGAPTWLATSAVQANLTVGQTYRVRLEMSGSSTTTLKLYVNGVLMLTTTDAAAGQFLLAGKAGIMSGENADAAQADSTGIQYENFQVTPSTYPRAADSKGTNTGDYKNGPTLGVAGALTGDANTAAQFDGVNDYVQMTGTTGFPVGAAVRSTELWFKTSSAAKQALFRYGSGASSQEYGLWIDAGGATMTAWGHSGTNDKTFTMPYAVNDGAWHHVVQTYNGTSLTLYIDGVALASQAATRNTVMDMYGFGIGAVIRPGDGNSGLFFNGSIDEVSFYTTVLSQTDVTNHHQLGTVVAPEPVVTTTGTDLAYIENGTPLLAPAITITDADSANLTAATVTMTTNYLNGQDTLAFTNQNGITGTWTAGTGVMALSGSATVAQYQTALRSITYNNNSNYPNASTRTATITVSDGTNTSNTGLKNVTITAVNDAPTGADGSAILDEDAIDSFATADFGMTDPTDNGAHTLTAVKITTLPVLGILKLSGVNVTVGQVVTAANITSGLLTYTPVGNANGTGYASFTFQVQDNGGTANGGIDLDASPNTITFNVTAVNDAPVNSVPATQSTPPSTAKVFSTGNGNLVSISDVDATMVQVQLVSTNGATTLFGTMPGSLSFAVGDGTADPTMMFTGTIAAVNTALNGLSFNPTTSFSGTASLQVNTNDLGATGTGGTLTDSDTITINVSGRPVVTATVANLAFTENGASVALDAGITVTDPDSNITGATISMTTNYVSGQDTLSFSTQNGITGNWVAGTGVLTLSGSATAANYQTALRSITYSNTADNLTSNNHNVNFVASDAIGAGNASSRQIAVTAVNDGPVNTVPGAQTTFKNTAKVFSGGNGNSITIADLDASPSNMRVQLVSTNGTTTLFGTMPGALTFSVGDGTADATMTFDGTISAVNTALNGLSFNPTTSFTGAASLQIVTSDLGATGSGGTLTDNDTVAISVVLDLGIFTANQDIGVPPGTAGSSSHSAGTYTVAGSGWDIWDIDDHFQFLSMPMTGDGRLTARVFSQTQTPSTSNAAKAGVMFRQTMAVGSINGMMGVTKANGSAFTYRQTTNGISNAATATAGIAAPYWVRLTRVGNVVTGERSPDGVTWTQHGTSQTITMGSTIYVGLAVSSVDTTKLNTATFDNVTFEQPPVLAASGGTTAHTENVPVAVDTGITVTDATSANMASGTVTVGSGYTAGQDVLAFTNQNGITGSWSAPTMTLTGSATKANWQAALRSVTYNNTSNAPNTGNRTVNFVVNDGIFTSNTGAKTVSVAAVNDAPVNSVPGAQTAFVNTAKVFSTGNGNLISITDADAAGGTMQVQLVSTNGVTTLSGTAGLTITAGANSSATMTFTGTLAAVNTALAGLSFSPTTSFTGAASLQILTADQGNTGSGGSLTDTDTITITVVSPSYFDTINGTSGLVSFWRLGEALSSSPMADSKGTNNGTYFGTPTMAGAGAIAGSSDTAVQFNGSSQYATATRQIQDDFSIEFWFKSTQSFGTTCNQWWQGAGLVDAEYGGLNNDFGVTLCQGKVIGGVGGGSEVSVVSSATYNNGAWHHVVFTRTKATGALALYVDGGAAVTATGSTVSLTATANINFGRLATGIQYYAGSLDEVAVYSSVLSGATVTAHYQSGTASADTSGPTGGSVDASGLVGTGSRYAASTTLSLVLAKGTDPSGVATTGNLLKRATATLTSGGAANGTCGTFGSYTTVTGGTDPASPKSDTVTDQACYSYQYVVLDTLGNPTTYTSPDIKVDLTAPAAPTLAHSAFTSTFWSSGSIVYYRSAASSGSFTTTSTATDTASGIASHAFPTLGTNWTSTPGALGVNTYSWSGAPAAPGAKNVTATNNATGVSGNTSFTPTADDTAPGVGTVTPPGATQSSTSVSVVYTTGTDGGSGVGTRLLQRQSATLTGTTCGSYGGWTTAATNPGSSPFSDTVTAGFCYKYQYVVSDNVGNTHTATSGNVVKVTAASSPLKAQYKNPDADPTNNSMQPHLQLVNTSASGVDLGTITVRYWFTKEAGASTFTTNCYYAEVGGSNITSSVTHSVVAVTPRTGADSYVLVGFPSSTLAAGASGQVQLGVNKTDWSNFSEADDYSYGTGTSYADTTTVTVYQGGTLIWGTEP